MTFMVVSFLSCVRRRNCPIEGLQRFNSSRGGGWPGVRRRNCPIEGLQRPTSTIVGYDLDIVRRRNCPIEGLQQLLSDFAPKMSGDRQKTELPD